MKQVYTLIAVFFVFFASFHAVAASVFFEIDEISGWRMIEEKHDKKTLCHAINYPYRHRDFSKKIEEPKIIVSYFGQDHYSISFSTTTAIGKYKSVRLLANGNEHILYGNSDINAVAYSATQDVHIINDIIFGPYIFKVNVAGRSGESSMFYFSSTGMKEAMLYMKQICGLS